MVRLQTLTLLTLTSFLLSCGGGGGGGSASDGRGIAVEVQQVLAGRTFPTDIAFGPDGEMYVAELTGAILLVRDGVLQSAPYATVAVPQGGGNGLLGIALSRDFERDGAIYAYHTHPEPLRNRVVRMEPQEHGGILEEVVVDGIPTGGHDGGKLLFKGDTLYISTGDAGRPSLALDAESLAGKILRVRQDGSPHSDNPDPNSAVLATGFRNVFGMAEHPGRGEVYVSDNGPECDDEINVVLPGGAYGWRDDYQCGESQAEFLSPIFRSAEPLGITDLAFYRGEMFPEWRDDLFFGDFNTGRIRRIRLGADGRSVELDEVIVTGEHGPILAITPGPDGAIYYSTPDAVYRIVRS